MYELKMELIYGTKLRARASVQPKESSDKIYLIQATVHGTSNASESRHVLMQADKVKAKATPLGYIHEAHIVS